MTRSIRRLLAVVAVLRPFRRVDANGPGPELRAILASLDQGASPILRDASWIGRHVRGPAGGYLYVLTQWGMGRASLADPLNPGPMTQFVIGKEGGSGNGGIIQINCDCHQGRT